MTISTGNEHLEQVLCKNYMFSHEILSKKEFLYRLWSVFSLIIQYNRTSPLVLKSIEKCPYIIPRLYTVISILYGAFGHEPQLKNIAKEFVCMLSDDIDKKEINVLKYASVRKYSFFPELYSVWEKINEIYTSGSFDVSNLPITPYHAYSLLTLNHSEIIAKNTNIREIFATLVNLQNNRNEIEILVQDKKDKSKMH